MIPRLIALDGVAAAGATKSPSPPLRFRPLVAPSHVSFRPAQYERAQGLTQAQKAGLRYESQVQRQLLDMFPDYRAGPYLHFLDEGRARTAQPDGLLIYPDFIFIFEVKYTHCPEAWWQLDQLYKPLIMLAFPDRAISLVEICRSYDPAVPFPCPVARFNDLVDWIDNPLPVFGIYEWKRP